MAPKSALSCLHPMGLMPNPILSAEYQITIQSRAFKSTTPNKVSDQEAEIRLRLLKNLREESASPSDGSLPSPIRGL